MWKVLRCTSAAPLIFEEFENYVDGGVLANNPSACALTVIQELHSKKKRKLPISMMVSIGGGVLPADKLGRTDAGDMLLFSVNWLKGEEKLLSRVNNMKSLLANAVCSQVLHLDVNNHISQSSLNCMQEIECHQ